MRRWGRFLDVDAGVVAVLLAAAVLCLGLAYGTMAASGADSYGYVSQAERWLDGDLIQPQPWVAEVPWPNAGWTFSPLGYRPYRDGNEAIVPTYAPGLPLLMAGAKLLGAPCASFWVVPLSGALLVLATFGIGRRLADGETGILAAWLVAVSPAFLFMSMWPMTDVPVATAWAIAFYCALGRTPAAAAAAGVATALAVLIRPNLALGAGILGLWYVGQIFRAERDQRATHLACAALYAVFTAAGIVATGWIHFHLYGSVLTSGYGALGSIFDPARIGENLRLYPLWLIESETPLAALGLAALLFPVRRLWPSAPDRAAFVPIVLFVLSIWAQYATYLVFDAWWYLRFLLATWPFMMLGSAAVLMAIARALPSVARVAIGLAIVGLGVRQFAFARERGLFELWKQEQRYPAVARHVRELTEPGSVLFAMQHSGSLRHYADRVTLRYDILDADWLDRALGWMDERGVRAYLLVDEWEVRDFERRFAAEGSLERVRNPLFTYVGTSKVLLFDLHRPVDPERLPRVVVEDYRVPRCEGRVHADPDLHFR